MASPSFKAMLPAAVPIRARLSDRVQVASAPNGVLPLPPSYCGSFADERFIDLVSGVVRQNVRENWWMTGTCGSNMGAKMNGDTWLEICSEIFPPKIIDSCEPGGRSVASIPVRYLFSAEVNSPRFAAGSPQRLGPGSGTMPVCTDLLHDAHHASYNLRHASEPMAHSGHRDSRMDEPATKRRHRVPTRREPRSP